MSTLAPALGDWPADGLEPVDQCPACASPARSLMYEGLTDRSYLHAPGHWDLQRCDTCSAAYLDPRPSRLTIHLAYGNYYESAGTVSPANGTGGYRRIRRAIRNGYLNGRYGYRLRPATRLGDVVVPLLPGMREMADEHVRHLPAMPGGRLLDVGCGEGEFVAEMAALGWDAHGIDPSVDAIAAARARGVRATVGSLADLSADESPYDAMTFRLVFEHLPDPVEALETCHRSLTPDGVLWIAAPNLDSDASRRFGDAWIFLEPPRHAVLYTARSLEALLRRCGFEPIAVRPSRQALWSFRLSSAIARGEPPFRTSDRLGLVDNLRARVTDLRALTRPEHADVLIFVARKR